MQLDNPLSFDKDELLKNNLPLANLYTYTLERLLSKYNVNIDSAIPHIELYQIMNKPFHVSVEQLTSSMNERLRGDLLDLVHYPNWKHPLSLTNQERDKVFSNLEKSLRLSSNEDIFMGNPWSIQEVDYGLISSIKKISGWNRAN